MHDVQFSKGRYLWREKYCIRRGVTVRGGGERRISGGTMTTFRLFHNIHHSPWTVLLEQCHRKKGSSKPGLDYKLFFKDVRYDIFFSFRNESMNRSLGVGSRNSIWGLCSTSLKRYFGSPWPLQGWSWIRHLIDNCSALFVALPKHYLSDAYDALVQSSISL